MLACWWDFIEAMFALHKRNSLCTLMMDFKWLLRVSHCALPPLTPPPASYAGICWRSKSICEGGNSLNRVMDMLGLHDFSFLFRPYYIQERLTENKEYNEIFVLHEIV